MRESAAGHKLQSGGAGRGEGWTRKGREPWPRRRSLAREVLEAAAPPLGRRRSPAPPRPALPCSVLPVPSRSVPPARSSHPPAQRRPPVLLRSHGSALLPGLLRRGGLRPGPHSLSLQPARERPGEWRGLSWAQGVQLSWRLGRAPPGACSRRAFAQNSASARETGRKCASPVPRPHPGLRIFEPSH